MGGFAAAGVGANGYDNKGTNQVLNDIYFDGVKVYRDVNKDLKFDETKIDEGVFGINIHKAGADSTYVENWSEGCQVFKKSADFEAFMTICRKAAAIHGKSFTYTLIESADIK